MTLLAKGNGCIDNVNKEIHLYGIIDIYRYKGTLIGTYLCSIMNNGQDENGRLESKRCESTSSTDTSLYRLKRKKSNTPKNPQL